MSSSERSGPPTARVRRAEARITEHFDDFAAKYHRTAFDGAGMRHLSDLDLGAVADAVALAARTAPDGRPVQACDVGVGTGRISQALLRAGASVVGVDASPEMLEQARERLPEADLRLGSLARELPVTSASVDVVTCLRVVKYLPDTGHALAELARVVRPGGIVCVDLANRWSPARLGYPIGMVHPVSRERARRLFDAAGLQVLEVRPGVHVPDPLWRRARSEGSARRLVRIEAAATRVLGPRGSRSWTFLARARGGS